jgi:hypothetical protein
MCVALILSTGRTQERIFPVYIGVTRKLFYRGTAPSGIWRSMTCSHVENGMLTVQTRSLLVLSQALAMVSMRC